MTLVNAETGEVVDRQVMPALEAEVRRAMRDSIGRFGVLVPIAVDQDGEIIDGHNRWAIAEELNVPCPSITVVVKDEADAIEVARSLNLDRRHLDRTTRAALAQSLRGQGHSLRAIAGALGVSHPTVLADLGVEDDSEVVSDLPPRGPGEAVGQDGKTYPAKRRPPWTADQLLAILDRIEAGEDRSGVKAELGLSGSNLGLLLTRARKIRGEAPIAKLARLGESERVAQITDLAARGLSSHQIAENIGVGFKQVRDIARRNQLDIPADAVVGKTRLIDSNRVVAGMAVALEAEVTASGLVDLDALDQAQIEHWATSISNSLRDLTRFSKRLKEMTQ